MESMTERSVPWREAACVFALALIVRIALALPGYRDACYYTVGAQQLAAGRGFTEPFIWNYLDDPQSLPRPSHQYWMMLTGGLSLALGASVLFLIFTGVAFRRLPVEYGLYMAGRNPWLHRLILYSSQALYLLLMGIFFMWGYAE